jgi:hypothetical protein
LFNVNLLRYCETQIVDGTVAAPVLHAPGSSGSTSRAAMGVVICEAEPTCDSRSPYTRMSRSHTVYLYFRLVLHSTYRWTDQQLVLVVPRTAALIQLSPLCIYILRMRSASLSHVIASFSQSHRTSPYAPCPCGGRVPPNPILPAIALRRRHTGSRQRGPGSVRGVDASGLKCARWWAGRHLGAFAKGKGVRTPLRTVRGSAAIKAAWCASLQGLLFRFRARRPHACPWCHTCGKLV